jgi:hypothetical protein
VYYVHPGCSIQSGLKLISSDYNVLEMVAAHVEVPVITLYLVSFDEPRVNDDEYEDYNDDNDGEYGENSRIDRDDPYWEEMLEPDLFDEDNNLPGPSMEGGIVERVVLRVMRMVMRVKMRRRIMMMRRRVMKRRMVIIKMQMQR